MPAGSGTPVRVRRYKKKAQRVQSPHARFHYTKSLVEPVAKPTPPTPSVSRCLSAPKVMEPPHSRSASPRERPLQRPPSPPSPSAPGFDNQAYQHDEHDPNHNDSFTSNGQNGHSKEPNGETKTLEAVNLELINLGPKNGNEKAKDVEADVNSSNPYDEYFVPVNEHKKYMRGEKLYVTADKRNEKGGCKRPLCWTLLTLVVAAIVALIALASTGVLFANSPTPVEPYNVSISSARALGGLGQVHDQTEHKHDHSTHDHSTHDHSTHDQVADTQKDQAYEHDNDTSMFVPRSLEGVLKVDNEEFTPSLLDPDSEDYQKFTTAFSQALKRALYGRNDKDVTIGVVKLSHGSIVVHYRIYWNPNTSENKSNEMTPQELDEKIKTYLENNSRMLDTYHIAEEQLTAQRVLDMCQLNKYDCEFGCDFDKRTLEFNCVCPPGQIAKMNDAKKCVPLLANIDENNGKSSDSQKESRELPFNTNPSIIKPAEDNIFDWKEQSDSGSHRVIPETTTEVEADLKFSNIFGSNESRLTSKTPNSQPEPTSEPAAQTDPTTQTKSEPAVEPEPAAEPKAEPEPTAEPDLSVEPKAEPEPFAEPEPKVEPEPTGEPNAEIELTVKPKVEPEPTGEPKAEPEPTAEPNAEHKSINEPKVEEPKPTAQPKLEENSGEEYKPEWDLAAKAESEPTAEPKAEPEPTAEPKAEPEPTAEPKAEPEPTAEPKAEPEPTAEPKAEPEPTAEPKAEPEPTAEPKAEPEPTAEPKVEPEPSVENSSLEFEIDAELNKTEPEQSSDRKREDEQNSKLDYLTSTGPETTTSSIFKLMAEVENLERDNEKQAMLPTTSTENDSIENSESNTEKGHPANSVSNIKRHHQNRAMGIPTTSTEHDTVDNSESDTKNGKAVNSDTVTKSDFLSDKQDAKSESNTASVSDNQSEENIDKKSLIYQLMNQHTDPNTELPISLELTENPTREPKGNSAIVQSENNDFTGNTRPAPSLEMTTSNYEVKVGDDTLEKELTTFTKTDSAPMAVGKLESTTPRQVSLDEMINNALIASTENSNFYSDPKYSQDVKDSLSKTSDKETFESFDIKSANTTSNKNFLDQDMMPHGINLKDIRTAKKSDFNDTTENNWLDEITTEIATTSYIPEPTIPSQVQKNDQIISPPENTYYNTSDSTHLGGDINNKTDTTYANKNKVSIAEQLNIVEGDKNLLEALNPNKTISEVSTTTESSADDGSEITFDSINTLYNRSSNAMNENNEPYETTDISLEPQTDSDWLVEPNSDMSGDEGMTVATTTASMTKIDEIINPGKLKDFEPDYLNNMGSNSNKIQDQDHNIMFGMMPDYDNSDDARVKRVHNTKDSMHNSTNQITTTDTGNEKINAQIETTTIGEFIYKTARQNVAQSDYNISEPAPVWEETDADLTVQKLQNETNSINVFNVNQVSSTITHNDNNTIPVNNLNVTIYEIPNHDTNSSLVSNSSIHQSMDFDDHETEMNPFLPDAENNKVLVKKLQEGHDLEPINFNETQNENAEDHSVSTPINYDGVNATEREQINTNTMSTTDHELNSETSFTENKSGDASAGLSAFLLDTDDLDKHTTDHIMITEETTYSANEKITPMPETTTATLHENKEDNFSVVPISDNRFIIKDSQKNLKSDRIQQLNDISDSPKKSDRRTLDGSNLDSVINNEA